MAVGFGGIQDLERDSPKGLGPGRKFGKPVFPLGVLDVGGFPIEGIPWAHIGRLGEVQESGLGLGGCPKKEIYRHARQKRQEDGHFQVCEKKTLPHFTPFVSFVVRNFSFSGIYSVP